MLTLILIYCRIPRLCHHDRPLGILQIIHALMWLISFLQHLCQLACPISQGWERQGLFYLSMLLSMRYAEIGQCGNRW
jgi:hypothetical protein